MIENREQRTEQWKSYRRRRHSGDLEIVFFEGAEEQRVDGRGRGGRMAASDHERRPAATLKSHRSGGHHFLQHFPPILLWWFVSKLERLNFLRRGFISAGPTAAVRNGLEKKAW